MTTPATPPVDSLAFRAASVLLCVAIACLLGTFSWLLSFVLWGTGALLSVLFGWELPAWTGILAFAVGMPLGGWLEFHGIKH